MLQPLDMFYKLVMQVYFHSVRCWKVRCGWFWPHRDEGIAEFCVVRERNRLKLVCDMVIIVMRKIYLVVSCNKLHNCVKNPFPCELARTCHGFEGQLLLPLLVRHLPSFFLVLFFLHGFPNRPWDCPMVYWYVCFFTSFFVDFIMTTNMKAAWWIPSFEKSLTLSI